MKLIVVALLSLAAVASAEFDWDNLDWSTVVPVEDLPGFWEGRDPAIYQAKRTDETPSGRIVGGAVVAPNSIPFQAGLLMAFGGGTGLCGGSVISNRAILTAAHCPIGSSSTNVRLGAHQISATEPTQVRITVGTGGYRLHANYNPSNLNNDIAILITPSAFGFTAAIQAVTLAATTAGSHAGDLATVSGWGRISDGSSATSTHLRSVQNNIITNAQCASTYGTSVVVASTICMSTAGGRGTCNGDSGGPLTVGAGRTQVGVVSFGAAAGCQAGFPAGFARVSSFRTWINNNMTP
jgi:secreted trypsin-like serine protease